MSAWTLLSFHSFKERTSQARIHALTEATEPSTSPSTPDETLNLKIHGPSRLIQSWSSRTAFDRCVAVVVASSSPFRTEGGRSRSRDPWTVTSKLSRRLLSRRRGRRIVEGAMALAACSKCCRRCRTGSMSLLCLVREGRCQQVVHLLSTSTKVPAEHHSNPSWHYSTAALAKAAIERIQHIQSCQLSHRKPGHRR